jgi:endonuclease III
VALRRSVETEFKRRELRSRVRRVVRILEATLGKPVQSRRLPPPVDMLIATILSQNTNDKNSHRAYTALRRRFPTWAEVARAKERTIRGLIRSGGMANQKAVRIQETLGELRRRHGSYDLRRLRSRPDQEIIEELTSLKGVGLKTAACVLLFSLRRDVFPVDTHVHRICNRLGLTPGCTTPEKTFYAMRPLVPRRKGYSFHTNLIRFGRRTCRSSSPACDVCPLHAECSYEGKERQTAKARAPSRANHDFMVLDNVRR